MVVVVVADLSRAQRARSGAPRVRKFSYLPIRENLVMTSAYSVRQYSLGVREGNEVSACRGEEYVIFLGGKSCDAFVQPAFFSLREIPQAFKNFFTLGTCF